MTTPQGTRAKQIRLTSGDAIHVYSNEEGIVLQLRRTVPTEMDLTATSFKVGVAVSPIEAIAVAGELLTVASQQLGEHQGGATSGQSGRA
jgi:hypothetical protein